MEETNSSSSSSSFSSRHGKLRRVTLAHPCPICGKPDWCRVSADGAIALCNRIEQGSYKSKTSGSGETFFVHRLDGRDPASLPPPVAAATAAAVERANDTSCAAVYSAFLAALTLSQAHREQLRQRGLADEEIDHRAYRTHLADGRGKLARDLRLRFGDVVLRVPGFYVKQGDNGPYLSIAGAAGLLIPVRDAGGRIVALRLRRDDGSPRYLWFSKDAAGSATSGVRVHIPKGIEAPCPVMRLTEGELKADVAFALSGVPTISLPGVGCWKPAVEVLKGLGCETVRLAFDMDARQNAAVARALDACAAGLLAEGFRLELETWDAAHKGIDDALAAKALIGITSEEESRAAIADIVIAGGGTPPDEPPKVVRGESWEGDDEEREEVYLPEWKPMPLRALPKVLRGFAIDYARALECDPAMLALFGLATLAGCIGRSRVIRLRPTWWEPCAVFGCVIGNSCCGKSAALREIIAPVELFDEELYKRSAERFDAYDTAVAAFDAWKPDAKGAEKPAKPVEPKDEQVILQDVTIEDVIKRMNSNPRGLLFPFEELRMWFDSMGRYKSSGGGYDQCIWINIFDGSIYHYSRSKHRQRMRNRILGSVCGGTQPKVWAEVASPMTFGSGMLGRILPVWPDKVPKAGRPAPPTKETTQDWHALVRAAALLDRDGTSSHDWQPVEMILTRSADECWVDWEEKWGTRLDAAEGDIHTMLARMKTYCARFALIAAVCDSLGSFDGITNGPNIVEAEHIRDAIVLCQWFAEEAERIYFRGRLDPNELKREEVLQKMRDRHGPKIPNNQWHSLTKRELYNSNRGKWKTTQAALAFLESLQANPNGTPGPVIRVGNRFYLRDKK